MNKIIFNLLCCGLAYCAHAQTTPSKTAQMDALLTAYTSLRQFNGSVLVAQKGKILLQKGYGLKNAETNRPNDANSIFLIYSVTKTFTSTLVFKLVEEGKLSLSDRLGKFYPSFPKGDSITLEHLLTHTSGLYDFTRGNNMTDHSEASFLAFLETQPLDFSPGTSWRYSNSGYFLLGFVIAKVTGMPYEKAVKQYIFDPLGMTHSGFNFKHLASRDKTTGYAVFSTDKRPAAVWSDSMGPFAAGAIYSTVGDLYQYHRGLQRGKIIRPETLKKATTPSPQNEGYGYGWQLGRTNDKTIASHSGGGDGYRSNFARIPEDDVCVVLLTNTENANTDLLTNALLDILYDKPYKVPFEVPVDRAVLERYTGTYQVVVPPLVFYVNLAQGRLTATVSGQPQTVLLAEREDYFFAPDANAYLEFPKDALGFFNEISIQQGGRSFSGKRIYPTWGLLGIATPKGWGDASPDLPFAELPDQKGVWVLNGVALSTGEIKFRFNNDWNVNYGDQDGDQILDWYGGNIKVEAGVYDVLLDFRVEGRAVYSISRKE